MDHAFFSDIHWDSLRNHKYTAPYIPTLKRDDDLCHFGCEMTGIPILTPKSQVESYVLGYIDGFSFDYLEL